MTRLLILLVLLTCAVSVGGQICLKLSMNAVGGVTVERLASPLALVGQLFARPVFWIGMMLYVLALALWLVVLSRFDLSLAYPLLSLNYVLLVLAGWLIFREPLTMSKVLGTVVICLGIGIIAR